MSKENADSSVELKLRRSPLQYRSRRTMARIMSATAELLDDEGPENLTTERVAERSGVNIATLYHYFPNKLALLHALAQQFGQQQQERLDEIYARRHEVDWRETVDKLIDAGFEFNRSVTGALAVARAMQSHAALREVDYDRDVRQSESVASLLAELGFKGSAAELRIRALVILQMVTSAFDKALMWYPDKADAIMVEVKVMLKQYIQFYIDESTTASSTGDTAD